MGKIYVFGHKKPDTDAVTSAIALSYLKRLQGFDCEPRVLGRINNETKFALNYFNVKYPKFLNDVKNQIKDVNYNKTKVYKNDSIRKCYDVLKSEKLSGAPVVDEDGKLFGIITQNDISSYLIEGDLTNICTSYSNLLNTLSGKEVLRFDEKISGKLNSSVIVTNKIDGIENAINSRVKMIIVEGNILRDEYLRRALENRINIIEVDSNINVIRLISQSNYISNIILTRDTTKFLETAYVNDFIETARELKHTAYPIVDKKNRCLGFLRLVDAGEKRNKQVILVDHNEVTQSVDGIEDADILEIIDHHKLGSLMTSSPINFRSMTVGSTNTIIYKMFIENSIPIPKPIAGIMLSGIISDTLLLKSPTTTPLDIKAVKQLSIIADVDYEKYGLEMFKAGSSIKGKTLEEILFSDFKVFKVGNIDSGIGQIFTTDYDSLKLDIDKMVDVINKVCINNEYNILALFITDIMKNGSHILFNTSSKNILEDSFGIDNLTEGMYLENIVSRKKQIIPAIIEMLERK